MSNRCDLLLARGLIREGAAGVPQRDKASAASGSSSMGVLGLYTTGIQPSSHLLFSRASPAILPDNAVPGLTAKE